MGVPSLHIHKNLDISKETRAGNLSKEMRPVSIETRQVSA